VWVCARQVRECESLRDYGGMGIFVHHFVMVASLSVILDAIVLCGSVPFTPPQLPFHRHNPNHPNNSGKIPKLNITDLNVCKDQMFKKGLNYLPFNVVKINLIIIIIIIIIMTTIYTVCDRRLRPLHRPRCIFCLLLTACNFRLCLYFFP
jgi:hypothetical protein